MADRISSLPDSLLLHILSFLPTQQAFATSLLSKRWKPLWLSLSTFDFDDARFTKNKAFPSRFVQFVNAVLILRDSKPIERFRLNCESFCLPSNINFWINAAIKHKVEQLELSLSRFKLSYSYFEFNKSLASSIFNCSTIRVLKLNWITVNSPPTVYLPSLKVMHLKIVKFQSFKCLVMLLSGCTLLEDLVLKYIEISEDPSNIYIEGLRQLVTADVTFPFIPLEALSNVKFLRLKGRAWSLSLDIPIFHNLTHMELNYFVYDWNWLVNLLRNCPKLQILVMHQIIARFSKLDKEEWLMDPKYVPQCLSSNLKQFYLREFVGSEAEFQLTRLIMMNARVLKTITICSISSLEAKAKLQIFKRLSSCPRGSATCELVFK